MPRFVYQYCYAHKTVEEYPACATGVSEAVRWSKAQTLPVGERPVVWEHPQTGEVRYPGRIDGPMPKYYADQGYQRKEFTSYQEHKKWTESKGLVNHKVEGIKDSVLKD